ncbi:hypothetical protein D1872_271830 [compost metagenome]
MLSLSLEGNDQNNRQCTKTNNSVRIAKTIPSNREHSRNKFILGQINRQQREGRIPRIGCQNKNERCRTLNEIVHNIPAEGLLGNLRYHSHLPKRSHTIIVGKEHNTREQQGQQ